MVSSSLILPGEDSQGIDIYKFQLPLGARSNNESVLVYNKSQSFRRVIHMNEAAITKFFGPPDNRRYYVYIKGRVQGAQGMQIINEVKGHDW